MKMIRNEGFTAFTTRTRLERVDIDDLRPWSAIARGGYVRPDMRGLSAVALWRMTR